MKDAPIGTPGAIGVAEIDHAPLRGAFEKLRTDLDAKKTDAECFQIKRFVDLATVVIEGLCTTLLVFGAITTPARTKPSQNQIHRSHCIESPV